jgi:Fe-Mn family superoxide dismutase
LSVKSKAQRNTARAEKSRGTVFCSPLFFLRQKSYEVIKLKSIKHNKKAMEYTAKDYNHLLGTTGFSDELLTTHFGLYNGYVANTNKLIGEIRDAEHGTPAYAELKRRFGWEWDGMRLHELYFDAMTKDDTTAEDAPHVQEKIVEQFGSLEAWQKDFEATGAMRGIGWVILVHDARADRLFNTWINEHDLGHLAGATPLVVMDVFEHAYMADYKTDRAAYMKSYFAALDWRVVEARLQ